MSTEKAQAETVVLPDSLRVKSRAERALRGGAARSSERVVRSASAKAVAGSRRNKKSGKK